MGCAETVKINRNADEEDQSRDEEGQKEVIIILIFFIPALILFIRVPLTWKLRYYLRFKYLPNQARSHSIFSLRLLYFVRPCGSPGYTTSSVGTFKFSFIARYNIRL